MQGADALTVVAPDERGCHGGRRAVRRRHRGRGTGRVRLGAPADGGPRADGRPPGGGSRLRPRPGRLAGGLAGPGKYPARLAPLGLPPCRATRRPPPPPAPRPGRRRQLDGQRLRLAAGLRRRLRRLGGPGQPRLVVCGPAAVLPAGRGGPVGRPPPRHRRPGAGIPRGRGGPEPGRPGLRGRRRSARFPVASPTSTAMPPSTRASARHRRTWRVACG